MSSSNAKIFRQPARKMACVSAHQADELALSGVLACPEIFLDVNRSGSHESFGSRRSK